MKSLNIKNIPTFIGVGHVSEQSCNSVINAFEVLDAHEGLTADGIDYTQKRSFDVNIPPNYALKNYQEELEDLKNQYCNFFEVELFGPRLSIVEHLNIQKYPKGGAFHSFHCDKGKSKESLNAFRELVFMTYLNTVEEGGETEFLNQKIKIKPEKGLTVIWPAGWTHIHRGIPSFKEEKLIITGWFSNGY